MSGTQKDRGAVLQFELDRKRVAAYPIDDSYHEGKTAPWKWRGIIHQAVNDVLENGGTLVVVADKETVTVVQRPDTERL